MSKRAACLSGVLAVAVYAAGCVGASKSADPLSPTVAGPIPGVGISAPGLMQPVNSHIAVDQQPVTLTITNSTTNGVRPISYLFEIATDTGFTNKVFTRQGVTPSASGQTALKLSDALATGHTYFWRSKADDGANSSDYSAVATFDVYTPIVIQAPVLVAPLGNITTDDAQPRFTMNNVARTGPVGTLTYVIEVSDSETFANKIAVWTFGETPNQSGLAAPGALPASRQLFWHARAADPTTVGPFSATAVFKTPAAVVVAPPSSGGGTGNGAGSAADQLNLSSAFVYNSPSDVANWPVTTSISHLDMSPGAGLSFSFSANGFWPDYTPPGWSGPLQYTVWAVVNINGQWYTSGFIQMWRTRGYTGAPIISNFASDWAYDSRWGPMMGHQPHAGEQMGFFVTAGDARGVGTVTSVRERSNVILVTLPAGDSGSFSY